MSDEARAQYLDIAAGLKGFLLGSDTCFDADQWHRACHAAEEADKDLQDLCTMVRAAACRVDACRLDTYWREDLTALKTHSEV